jgi:hypothetical protein
MAFEIPPTVSVQAHSMRANTALQDASKNRFPVFVRLRIAADPTRRFDARIRFRWMVSDLVQGGSGISVDAHELMLAVRFPSRHAALTASRRMQWAAQGYAETTGLAECSLAILVLDPEDLRASAQPPAEILEQVPPRQIWLSARVAAGPAMVPGFQLGHSPNRAFREMQWLTPALDGTRSADDARLARLLSAAGKPFVTVPASGLDLIEPDTHKDSARRAWLYTGGGVAAAGIAALGIVLALHGKPAAIQETPAVVDSQELNGGGGTPNPSTPKTIPAPGPEIVKTIPKNCHLTDSQIPGQLQAAQKNLEHASYRAAITQYDAILACQPENATASSELKKARQMQQIVEGTSSP